MKIAAKFSRILLGLVFFVFGLNGFLHFIPQPALSGDIADFMNGLMKTGYFFPLLKGTETIVGLLLLTGYLVPLALVILTPVLLNIFLFHLFLEPASIVMAIVLVVLHIILTVSNWSAYKAFFNSKNAWKT
jgi:putative oxidoreductase